MKNQTHSGPVTRVRRNHALEHATLQILGKKNSQLSLAGSSDMGGFWVLGNIETEELAEGVNEALNRLKHGESHLAIHPNCGTNFATTGILAGAAAWLAMMGAGSGMKRKLERLPLIISLVTLVLIFSQPLGPILQQRFTTLAKPGGMKVTAITRYQRGKVPLHRVATTS